MNNKTFKYLALGDSYTIGEAVEPEQNFPNQLRGLLRDLGIECEPVRIIAKTGWTTDELMEAIEQAEEAESIPTDHDLVTLLIGVNNQYRGRDVEEFAAHFTDLLLRAIRYAGNDPAHVRVLSIPDWGITPYAEGRNRDRITREIDSFNEQKREICQKTGVTYLYITDLTREASTQPAWITGDGLHPSGLDYGRWAKRLLSTLKVS